MSFKKIMLLIVFILFSTPLYALEEDDVLPPEQAFKISAKVLSADQLEISFDISKGYYLYQSKLHFASQTASVKLAEPILPEGIVKHDEFFGDVVTYRNILKIPFTLENTDNKPQLQVLAQYQGCADKGICYPPQKTVLSLDLPTASTLGPLSQLLSDTNTSSPESATTAALLPAEQAFQFFATIKDGNTLRVNWNIAEGYYLYREQIQLSLSNAVGAMVGDYQLPHGSPYHDEEFGNVEIFRNTLSFDLPLKRTNPDSLSISLLAKYQGCADRGVCYPPMSKQVNLSLPAAETLTKTVIENTSTAVSETDQIAQALKQDSLWLTLLSFFGFGLLLSLTPCIFPMLPILSGLIIGQGNISTFRGFVLSLSYVVASAITYTVFGVLAAFFGGNLQAVFQQPWIIASFSTVFVLLSLSMFGFYHLEVPKSFQAKLHNSSERHRNGSLWGTAIMGSLSALIVGPCVAAPLAGALIYIGQTGDALLGGSALFVMGIGMGVPLLILGTSAGKLLPKSGEWLNSIKAVFGVIMLAVAVWMLQRILPSTISMLLWAMLLVIPAIYLNAIDPLPAHSSGWHKLWKGIGLMMLSYGLLLLIGISLGNANPLKPLQGLGLSRAEAAVEKHPQFTRISSVAELETRILEASAKHQIVMLDYYADWCISCKEMASYTFTNSAVGNAMAEFVLLQADVTQNTDNDKALLDKFHLIGPPAILFFGPDQQEKAQYRVIGYQDAETFIKTLQKVKL
ncbi:MAG: protein-disulfide reductase DsbD [Methylococcaceae bacterium]|jgi:thiol:disulfide interchange protein DsbD